MYSLKFISNMCFPLTTLVIMHQQTALVSNQKSKFIACPYRIQLYKQHRILRYYFIPNDNFYYVDHGQDRITSVNREETDFYAFHRGDWTTVLAGTDVNKDSIYGVSSAALTSHL